MAGLVLSSVEFTVLPFDASAAVGDGFPISATEFDTLYRGILNEVSSLVAYAFEATMSVGSAGETAYAGLWDVTAGDLVPGSTVSTTSTTPTPVRSGPITLTSGHVYSIAAWASAGTTMSFIYARIVGVGMTEPVIASSPNYEFTVLSLSRMGTTEFTSAAEADPGYRSYIERVSEDVVYAFEATIWSEASASGTTYAAVWDVTAGDLVPGSTVSVTNAPWTPVRSGAITLIAGHVYSLALWGSTSTGVTEASEARIIGIR